VSDLPERYSPHDLLAQDGARLLVRVRQITFQGENLNEYELVDPNGHELPPFTAGSHVDLYFRDGRVRQYSLCNPEWERSRYRVVVQRALTGRGGSRAIFERVHVGRLLVISRPRNRFPLKAATRYLLLGGGIGITPLMSFVSKLQREQSDFKLIYCARSPELTAFRNELGELIGQGKALLHHDNGDPSRALNLEELLKNHPAGTHLYYCGPPGFMRAVEMSTKHWPASSLHFEHFTPPSGPRDSDVESGPERTGLKSGFEVHLKRRGISVVVPEGRTIVDALRERGVEVPTSCEAGLCGTCRTEYLEGEPDHRDYILTPDERTKYVLICCARAKSGSLTLDL